MASAIVEIHTKEPASVAGYFDTARTQAHVSGMPDVEDIDITIRATFSGENGSVEKLKARMDALFCGDVQAVVTDTKEEVEAAKKLEQTISQALARYFHSKDDEKTRSDAHGAKKALSLLMMCLRDNLNLGVQLPFDGAKPTATFIKDLEPRKRGTAKLYRVSPPLTQQCYCCDQVEAEYDYVIASALISPGAELGDRQEVLIFGADADGQMLSSGELDGSYRGGIDHEKALKNAGYEVAK